MSRYTLRMPPPRYEFMILPPTCNWYAVCDLFRHGLKPTAPSGINEGHLMWKCDLLYAESGPPFPNVGDFQGFNADRHEFRPWQVSGRFLIRRGPTQKHMPKARNAGANITNLGRTMTAASYDFDRFSHGGRQCPSPPDLKILTRSDFCST